MRKSSIKKVSGKQRAKNKRLKTLNFVVWTRDFGKCLLCESKNIAGKSFVTGAHHILSRGAAPSEYLEIKNLCLLCKNCHNSDADTVPMRRKLIQLMAKLYPEYDYNVHPYQWYLDDTIS